MFASDTLDASQVTKAPIPVKTPEPQPSYDEDGEYSPHSFMVWFNILLHHSLLK